MTKNNRAPKLYITSELLEKAQDEGVTGATAHSSAQEVIRRGGEGRLDGLSVSRLVLHTTTEIDNRALKVFRVRQHEHADRFAVSDQPGTHPRAFVEQGLGGEVHTLIVPTEEFDETATAWALHNAAARYSLDLPPSRSGEHQKRAPTKGFGIPAIDKALGLTLTSLGESLSRFQRGPNPESPESITKRLHGTLDPLIGIARDIQGLGNEPDVQGQPQPLVQPFTPAEMGELIDQDPPIVFYSSEQ